jgi:hypothetical protein
MISIDPAEDILQLKTLEYITSLCGPIENFLEKQTDSYFAPFMIPHDLVEKFGRIMGTP